MLITWMSLTLLSTGLACKPFKTPKGTFKAEPMINHWWLISANKLIRSPSLGTVFKISGVPA